MFSQSLLSLDLIEEFLAREHVDQDNLKKKGEATAGQIGTWDQGRDYYRSTGFKIDFGFGPAYCG